MRIQKSYVRKQVRFNNKRKVMPMKQLVIHLENYLSVEGKYIGPMNTSLSKMHNGDFRFYK